MRRDNILEVDEATFSAFIKERIALQAAKR